MERKIYLFYLLVQKFARIETTKRFDGGTRVLKIRETALFLLHRLNFDRREGMKVWRNLLTSICACFLVQERVKGSSHGGVTEVIGDDWADGARIRRSAPPPPPTVQR